MLPKKYDTSLIGNMRKAIKIAYFKARPERLHAVGTSYRNTLHPSQKACITVTKNKIQLISHICLYFETQAVDLLQSNNRLLLTRAEPTHPDFQWRK